MDLLWHIIEAAFLFVAMINVAIVDVWPSDGNRISTLFTLRSYVLYCHPRTVVNVLMHHFDFDSNFVNYLETISQFGVLICIFYTIIIFVSHFAVYSYLALCLNFCVLEF